MTAALSAVSANWGDCGVKMASTHRRGQCNRQSDAPESSCSLVIDIPLMWL